MKRLVVSTLGNKIYYANIKKDGTMGTKEDVTNSAIATVFEHLSKDITEENRVIEIRFKSKEGYVLKMIKE